MVPVATIVSNIKVPPELWTVEGGRQHALGECYLGGGVASCEDFVYLVASVAVNASYPICWDMV